MRRTLRPTCLFQSRPLRESLDRGVVFQRKKLDVFVRLARTAQNAAWSLILRTGRDEGKEMIPTVEERQQFFPNSVGRLEELIRFRKLVRAQRSRLLREFCSSDIVRVSFKTPGRVRL